MNREKRMRIDTLKTEILKVIERRGAQDIFELHKHTDPGLTSQVVHAREVRRAITELIGEGKIKSQVYTVTQYLTVAGATGAKANATPDAGSTPACDVEDASANVVGKNLEPGQE